MKPVLTPLAAEVYERLGPTLTDPDGQHDWVLAHLVAALVAPLNLVDATVGREGDFAPLFSITQCPDALVPWLAQLLGITLPPGANTETSRAVLAGHASWFAGTPAAIIGATQTGLTGSKRVDLDERADPAFPGEDRPWHFTITVYEAEVAASMAAIVDTVRSVTDAELQFTVRVRPGWSFGQLATSGLSFRDVARLSCRQLKAIVPDTPQKQIEELMTL